MVLSANILKSSPATTKAVICVDHVHCRSFLSAVERCETSTVESLSVHLYERCPDNSECHCYRKVPSQTSWRVRGRGHLPAVGLEALDASLRLLQPEQVFLVLPPVPVQKLGTEGRKDAYEVASALGMGSYQVIVLIDGVVDARTEEDYDAIFESSAVFQSVAARQVFAAVMGLTASPANIAGESRSLWSGPLELCVPDGPTASLPCFTLRSIGNSIPSMSCSTLTSSRSHPARLISVHWALPRSGAFLAARDPLELHMEANSASATGAFVNEWVTSRVSLLLQIGTTFVWCFWSYDKTGLNETRRCLALVVPDISNDMAYALDVSAFRREKLGHVCREIFQMPEAVTRLPTFDELELVRGAEGSEGDEVVGMNGIRKKRRLNLRDFVDEISNNSGHAKSLVPGCEDATAHLRILGPDSCTVDGFAALDRRFLRHRSAKYREPEKRLASRTAISMVVETTPPSPGRCEVRGGSQAQEQNLRGVDSGALPRINLSKDDRAPVSKRRVEQKCSVPFVASMYATGAGDVKPKVHRGRHAWTNKKSTRLATNDVFRQHRFARLQSARGVRVSDCVAAEIERAKLTAAVSTKKRQRASAGSDRLNEVTRRGLAYIERASHLVLESLKAAPPFFKFAERRDITLGPSGCCPSQRWRCLGSANSNLQSRKMPHQATYEGPLDYELWNDETHGVEYAKERDRRDRHIMRYEQLIGKSGSEFSSSMGRVSAERVAKLHEAVSKLQCAGAQQRAGRLPCACAARKVTAVHFEPRPMPDLKLPMTNGAKAPVDTPRSPLSQGQSCEERKPFVPVPVESEPADELDHSMCDELKLHGGEGIISNASVADSHSAVGATRETESPRSPSILESGTWQTSAVSMENGVSVSPARRVGLKERTLAVLRSEELHAPCPPSTMPIGQDSSSTGEPKDALAFGTDDPNVLVERVLAALKRGQLSQSSTQALLDGLIHVPVTRLQRA